MNNLEEREVTDLEKKSSCKYCEQELQKIVLEQERGGRSRNIDFCRNCERAFIIYKPKKEVVIKTTHDIIGTIVEISRRKAKTETIFYEIELAKEENRDIGRKIYAYQDLIKRETVWNELENSQALGKKYIFTVIKKNVNKLSGILLLKLIDWREINSDLQTSKMTKSLEETTFVSRPRKK